MGIYQEWFGEQSTTSLNIAIIRPRLEDPGLEERLLPVNYTGKFKKKTGWLARLLYDFDFSRVRLGVTVGDFRLSYDGDVLGDSIISMNDARFNNRPIILSAQYNGERLEISAEYNFRKSIYSNFDPYSISGVPIEPNNDVLSLGYYLQTSYLLKDKWRVFARFDNNTANRDDPRGVELGRMVGQPNYNFFSNDLTFGVRWDIDNHWMISTEVHSIEGTVFLSDLENGPRNERSKNWSLLSALVSFRF